MLNVKTRLWSLLSQVIHAFQSRPRLSFCAAARPGTAALTKNIKVQLRLCASWELAMHVLEVLDALERSSIEGRHVMIETPCERPEPVPRGEGEEVFAAS
jgi:hypothetical protein